MPTLKQSLQEWAISFRREEFIRNFPQRGAYIPLSRGLFAVVDESDFEWLNQWKWCADAAGYAVRGIGKNGKTQIIKMHRLIMNTPFGMGTDHINGSVFDNRRCNLRICTFAENLRNRSVRKDKKSCKYKGVYKGSNNWQALIYTNGKLLHLGRYSTAKEAAIAYDKAALQYYKEFSRVNFPKL